VIDNFKSDIDVNKDGIADISHGEIVLGIVKEIYPEAQVLQYKTESIFNGDKSSISEVNNSINEILKLINSGVKIDAVNISLASNFDIKTLGYIIDEDLKADNLSAKNVIILEKLKEKTQNSLSVLLLAIKILESKDKINDENFKNPFLAPFIALQQALLIKNSVGTIENIEKLTNKGVSVYLSGGNTGSESFNLLSLAKNSITVGATEDPEKRIKSDYSVNNNLVDKWNYGTIDVFCEFNGNKLNRYDVAKLNTLSNISQETESVKYYTLTTKGTSFAAPRTLAEDLKQKYHT